MAVPPTKANPLAPRDNVKQHPPQRLVLTQAFCGLHHIFDEKSCDVGVLDAVLAAMQEHLYNEQVQCTSCLCVSNFIDLNPRNIRLIIEKGGLELIIQALENHPKGRLVQEAACKCLYNLASHDKRARALIISKGGVCALAKSQHQFFGRDPNLEELARQAMMQLLKK
jgi:hypothetical protein